MQVNAYKLFHLEHINGKFGVTGCQLTSSKAHRTCVMRVALFEAKQWAEDPGNSRIDLDSRHEESMLPEWWIAPAAIAS